MYHTQRAPVPSEPPETVRLTEPGWAELDEQMGSVPKTLIDVGAVDIVQATHDCVVESHPLAQLIPLGVVHWPLELQTWWGYCIPPVQV